MFGLIREILASMSFQFISLNELDTPGFFYAHSSFYIFKLKTITELLHKIKNMETGSLDTIISK